MDRRKREEMLKISTVNPNAAKRVEKRAEQQEKDFIKAKLREVGTHHSLCVPFFPTLRGQVTAERDAAARRDRIDERVRKEAAGLIEKAPRRARQLPEPESLLKAREEERLARERGPPTGPFLFVPWRAHTTIHARGVCARAVGYVCFCVRVSRCVCVFTRVSVFAHRTLAGLCLCDCVSV